MRLTILEQSFELMPERAVHWLNESTLIVTDLHLGKSGHFRKSGIAAPHQINQTNIKRLDSLVNELKPDRLLILGDLFHSDVNREWFQFEDWRANYPQLNVVLVAGNHDSLHDSFYEKANLDVYNDLYMACYDQNGNLIVSENEAMSDDDIWQMNIFVEGVKGELPE